MFSPNLSCALFLIPLLERLRRGQAEDGNLFRRNLSALRESLESWHQTLAVVTSPSGEDATKFKLSSKPLVHQSRTSLRKAIIPFRTQILS